MQLRFILEYNSRWLFCVSACESEAINGRDWEGHDGGELECELLFKMAIC